MSVWVRVCVCCFKFLSVCCAVSLLVVVANFVGAINSCWWLLCFFYCRIVFGMTEVLEYVLEYYYNIILLQKSSTTYRCHPNSGNALDRPRRKEARSGSSGGTSLNFEFRVRVVNQPTNATQQGICLGKTSLREKGSNNSRNCILLPL